MKKILCFLLLFSFLSCDELLDKEPYGLYTDADISTPKGMELLLTGVYRTMAGTDYYGLRFYLCEASKGPDFFVLRYGGGVSFIVENAYSASARLNNNNRYLWQTIYKAIHNLTVLLEKIDNVWGGDETLRRIKGEAYLLRGLCYFDLMRLFAYPPLFSIPGHNNYEELFCWGVPIVSNVTMGTNIGSYEIRRETADSTYKFIIEQFKLAEEFLEGRNAIQNRANAATAKALLIRAYLYLEDWNKVIEEGEAWINKYGSFYAMIPYERYTTTYYKPFNSESIWEFEYTSSDNLGVASLNYWARKPSYNEPGERRDGTVSQETGYARLGLSKGATTRGYDVLTNYPDDVRSYLICQLGTFDYLSIRKYVGDPYHFVHNVPVVRLPEIYLSLAEAYAKAGNYAKATEYASIVSQARRKANTNVAASINNILDERRRELILEGHTFWDYFRTARNMTHRQIIESIDDATINFGTVTGAHYRVVYPIPLSELNVNPAIREQQNPGYEAWYLAIGDDDD